MKDWFLAIFAKFRTSWQPWSWPQPFLSAAWWGVNWPWNLRVNLWWSGGKIKAVLLFVFSPNSFSRVHNKRMCNCNCVAWLLAAVRRDVNGYKLILCGEAKFEACLLYRKTALCSRRSHHSNTRLERWIQQGTSELRQKFATGIFKVELMSFLDKNKKWICSHSQTWTLRLLHKIFVWSDIPKIDNRQVQRAILFEKF